MLARKGFEREHHFAHASAVGVSGCGGGVESALHQYAKQVIAEAGYLAVPALLIKLPPPDNDLCSEIPSQHLVFTRVEVEESMVFGRRRVDVVGYFQNSRLLIEIYVTHRVRGKKLREVKTASEAMLEIEVSWESLYPRNSERDGSLRNSILDALDNKRWLFHPEGEKIRVQLQNQARARRAALPSIQVIERTKLGSIEREHPSKPKFESNHVPSRGNLSDEEYVKAMHAFLNASQYSDATRKRVIFALRKSGNITDRDFDLAANLGLTF